jgi:sugar lactone lactonase YvrE
MQGTLIVKNSVKILLCFFLLLVLVSGVQAAETYQFVTKWGTNGTGEGQFESPTGISIDSSGNVYISDSWLNRIQKFDSRGNFLSKWGVNARETPSPPPGQFSSAFAVRVDPAGNLYVIDTGGMTSRIQKFTPDGRFITTWGSYGSGAGQFNFPWDLATDSYGNVYVVEVTGNRIQKFSPNGAFITAWGSIGSGDGQFNRPLGIAIDSSDNVYVADASNNRIQKFTSDGKFIGKWGTPGSGNDQLYDPAGLAIDSAGNVLVVDRLNYRIQKFNKDGSFITTWGTKGTGNGQFIGPFKIAVDSRGAVYVLDYDSYNPDNPAGYVKGTNIKRIQKFEPVTPITQNIPASLTVTSNPTGADIFIDGVQRGTTPYTFTDIAPGTHSVIVSKIGYLGKYSTITLSQGQPSTVDVTLESLQQGTGTGTISVISDPPGAGIMLDGKYSGKATPYDFSGISSGIHTVEMTLVGYNSYTESVTVVPGTTVVVKKVWISTPPTKIVVFVNSNPDGANVYIDDSLKGVTPTSLHLDKGTYILKLTKKDYVSDESPLYVGSSGPITVTRTLNLPDPGFEGILAVISLVAVVLLVRRFR